VILCAFGCVKEQRMRTRVDLVFDLSMLNVVYFDLSDSKSIVAIKPKPPFRPVFDVTTARENSGVILLQNE